MAVRDDFTAGEVLAAADLNDTFAAKLNLAGGKVLQVVRATDVTQRSTTSTSFVDASISVTITPQRDTSAIILIWSAKNSIQTSGNNLLLQITDNSNNALSGAESVVIGGAKADHENITTLFGYSTPATLSATTYKGRFRSGSGTTVFLTNNSNTGQLYAIEVSA
jgi:hypothetical protein